MGRGRSEKIVSRHLDGPGGRSSSQFKVKADDSMVSEAVDLRYLFTVACGRT